MLCGRLGQKIIDQQSVDQAAYRPGFSTEDHLLCITLLLEKCKERQVPVWLGLVDSEKACKIEHQMLWKALKELRFKVLDTATFEIGDFSIIEFRGNPKKPTKWRGI